MFSTGANTEGSSSGLCLLAWKRRTGVGGLLQSVLTSTARLTTIAGGGGGGGSSHSSTGSGSEKKTLEQQEQHGAWEQRWIVVAGTQLLYYRLGDEDNETPRGSMDLIAEQAQIQVSAKPPSDAPSKHVLDIVATKGKTTTTSGAASASAASSSSASKDLQQWKLCFMTQEDLMQFLETVHKVQDAAGQYESKDTERFEHDFVEGDHLYRWEMIVCPPVIYPIQIHAIVLSAGRNCVVLADFGLTGYGRKDGSEFNHADDHATSSAILAAFKKLRPQQDQRLNIFTLTDTMDIRKWTKANYEESFFSPDSSQKFNKLSKFFSKLSRSKDKEDSNKTSTAEGEHDHLDTSQSSHHQAASGEDGTGADEPSSHSQSQHQMQDYSESSNYSTASSSRRKEPLPELPKSDPVPIVLARANYILENEHLLPPYHVFYSNSECIAVWCKTGRWSTLQTAVFLSTTSVGGAKSATLATMGVAAAHALLAPVVAVGGLIWVGAPMLILQKSREKWQENTELMTDLFWSTYAPPSVYVAAIENWSGLCIQDEEEEENTERTEDGAATKNDEDASEGQAKG